MNQQCQKLSVHKNFSLGRLKFNSYLWQLPALPTSRQCDDFFLFSNYLGKQLVKHILNLLHTDFPMDQPGQANRAPPELEMPTKVREFCTSSWGNSYYLSPWRGGGGGGGGRAEFWMLGGSHDFQGNRGRISLKWQALRKGGKRHEKKKKKNIRSGWIICLPFW